MRRILTSALLSITLLFLPFISYSWNAGGHMVVAQIAYQQLKPAVRDKITELLNYFQKEYPASKSFLQISYWPDTLHFQKIETFNHWHYIDVAFSTDNTPLKNLLDSDNAVWALKNIETVVENEKANPYERARFLVFLIHIVGDLHQPLHTVTLISAAHPNGDRGGNDYVVQYKDKNSNLHRLWDAGLGSVENDMSESQAEALAAYIMGHYPEDSFGQRSADLNPDNWVKEGVNNAKKYVYTTPERQAVSESYIQVGKQTAQQEIALAGYRLARLLNQLLG